MIDIHTHILPNIDDGARSIEETFNLIKKGIVYFRDPLIIDIVWLVPRIPPLFDHRVYSHTIWRSSSNKRPFDAREV